MKFKYTFRPIHLLYALLAGMLIYYVAGLVRILFFTNKKHMCVVDYPYFGKKHKTVEASTFEQSLNGYNFTMVFWIKITDWEYKMTEPKHIFSKGDNNYNIEDLNQVAPAVFLANDINNMHIFLSTEAGVDEIVVEDISIGNWTQVAIVCHDSTVEIYKDAKLFSTHILNAYPQLNFGDLHVCSHGGFGGYIAKLTYSPIAYKIDRIERHFKKGPR